MKVLSQFRKKIALTTTAVALAASTMFAPAAFAQETIKWRVQSHWPASSSSFKDSLERLRDTLDERTNGRLQLQLYEDGALFKAKETFNAVSRGIIQMGTISPSYAQDKIPLAGVASGLPFAFRNVWEAVYFHKHLGFEKMLQDQAAKHGVYYSTDKIYPTELVSRKPINTWEDFTKLKIRSSGAMQTFLTDAGAAASYLPGSELYTALSTGVVDAAHWGAAQGADSMGLYDLTKYHVQPALNIAGTDAIIVSMKAMDKLPKDIRDILVQTLEEQFWSRTNEYLYQERIVLARAIKDRGVQINDLPEDVLKRLTEAAQKSWDVEAKRHPSAAEAVKMVRAFLTDLGYL